MFIFGFLSLKLRRAFYSSFHNERPSIGNDSFEIPRGQGQGQGSHGGDIELGAQANADELGLQNFFKKVQEIDKQYEKLDKLLKKLQDAHEESKAVTKAPAMKCKQ
ncbi:syntaxin-132-like protein [Gossypium australe]|uniref:Syntaxin-132-like protein n=1 Tax=Gossypium australe TaxID=47621 RepID=A0A5B6VHW5_9ROSI|nr:syntaxin-132-like protein [Gossypium australe]